jgi:hypothetical protein
MDAQRLLMERHQVATDAFVELRVWRAPTRVRGSAYQYKYALAGRCVLRYDNEAGKGDHKHVGDCEVAYRFTTPRQLLADFWSDVDRWRPT